VRVSEGIEYVKDEVPVDMDMLGEVPVIGGMEELFVQTSLVVSGTDTVSDPVPSDNDDDGTHVVSTMLVVNGIELLPYTGGGP